MRPTRLPLATSILLRAGTATEALELDARRRVFEFVRSFPGFHLREVARAIGLDANHARYHLDFLEKSGLVSSRKEEGYTRYYPREEGSLGLRERFSPREKALLGLLRQPVPLHVALLLLERQQATHGELLAQVRVAHATLHYHLRKMEREQLVASQKLGRERVFTLIEPDVVRSLLVHYRPPDGLVQGFLEAWEQFDLL